MGTHRRVTEEDLHVTEAMLADSFTRLKRSITEAPKEAVRPASDIIREHPFASTAAAAGAGIIAFQLMKLIFSSGTPRREIRMGRGGISRGIVGGLGRDVMGQVMALATPYIASAIERQITRALYDKRR